MDNGNLKFEAEIQKITTNALATVTTSNQEMLAPKIYIIK